MLLYRKWQKRLQEEEKPEELQSGTPEAGRSLGRHGLWQVQIDDGWEDFPDNVQPRLDKAELERLIEDWRRNKTQVLAGSNEDGSD